MIKYVAPLGLAIFAVCLFVFWLPYLLICGIFDPWNESAPADIASYCWYVDYDPEGRANDRQYRLVEEPARAADGWIEVIEAWYVEQDRRGFDSLIMPFRDQWHLEPSVKLRSDADVRIYDRCQPGDRT